MKKLQEDNATGPDGIAARVLKRCAPALKIPLAIICRAVLSAGVWPRIWKHHWIFPIHKKKARSDPSNYRGVHLTAQASKVVERVLGSFLKPFLEQTGAYGPNQFAYSSGRGTRDAVALCVLTWLHYLDQGSKVGIYCSDVAGAFDRVAPARLLEKLSKKGVHELIIEVVTDWLGDRTATVIVDGTASKPSTICNSVYQGTVLGPPLWNTMYEDARHPINSKGYTEAVFADDLNCYRPFAADCNNEVILQDLADCQAALHSWGAANQVTFDAGKESFHVLHRRFAHGGPFKILGVIFDEKLTMEHAINEISAKARARVVALLRGRCFFATRALARMYKMQVLSFIEAATPAMYHAPAFFLLRLDAVQDKFLLEHDVDPRRALLEFKLAPLSSRRDIAMLGLTHRTVLGKGPSQFKHFSGPARGRFSHAACGEAISGTTVSCMTPWTARSPTQLHGQRCL